MAARPKTIDFRSEEERQLFQVAELGERVRFFLTTPVGDYLHRRCKQVILQCEADALQVDPDGWRGWLFGRSKLRQLRMRAEAARMVINFLGEALLDGNAAARAIEGQDEPDLQV